MPSSGRPAPRRPPPLPTALDQNHNGTRADGLSISWLRCTAGTKPTRHTLSVGWNQNLGLVIPHPVFKDDAAFRVPGVPVSMDFQLFKLLLHFPNQIGPLGRLFRTLAPLPHSVPQGPAPTSYPGRTKDGSLATEAEVTNMKRENGKSATGFVKNQPTPSG